MADPYAGIGSPVQQQADPYAGLGAPVPTAPKSDPYSGLGTPPPAAAVPRAQGATDIFGQIGQTYQDLTDSNHPDHDPNSLESGIIGAAYSKPVQYLQGKWNQNAVSGLFSEPTRIAMEKLGVGRQYGESDASLHQRYNDAMTASRQQAQQQITNNQVGSYNDGNPLHAVERFGQQASGVATDIAANPQYFLAPSLAAGRSASLLGGVSAAALENAGISGASDAAAQLMDVAEGQKKAFDVQQNLEQAAGGAIFGGATHGALEGISMATPVVSDYVKSLFSNRGMDTNPATAQAFAPMTGDHVAMNAADHAQYQQLLHTGSVDDIKNFFKGRQGPQPSWSDVNTWVEHRDNPPVSTNGVPGPDSSRQPDFNYEQEYNDHAEQQWRESNRQAVEQHVQSTMADWANKPDVNVVHGPEDIEDPTYRQEVLDGEARGIANGQGRALGTKADDGSVHIFSGRIPDTAAANSVLFHEGLGHFGLSTLFQGKLNATLVNLADRNVGQFGKDVAARQNATGESRALAAEEVLAHKSQNGQMSKTLQGAVDSVIRRFGMKMGFKTKYTDAEINNILAMAHDAVVNGKSDATSNGFRGRLKPGGSKFMFTGDQSTGFSKDHSTAFTAGDGHMRNEISDRDAHMYESPGDTLGSTMKHPALFEQYPELHSMRVNHINRPDVNFAGGYDADTRTMMINHGSIYTAGNPLDVVLHETQHAIQHIEQYPDFMRAMMHGGTGDDPNFSYNDHPSEIEARATEQRRNMRDGSRERHPPKFMTTDELGNIKENPENLDEIDRLKTDPRYWQDREYRQNVNELARVRATQEDGGMKAAKFITENQLNRSGVSNKEYEAADIEGIAKHIDENYEPLVMSHDEIKQQALENGINPNKFKSRNPGELATRLAKIGYASRYLADQASSLLEKLDTPAWKPEDHVKLAQLIAKRDALVSLYKGEGNEIGRALNIAKVFKELTNGNLSDVIERLKGEESGLAALADPGNPNSVKFARQLKTALAGGNNPKGANALMTGVTKPYWEQYLTTFHMNAMLSALSTHVKAPVDMMTGIGRNVIEKALALPIGQVRNIMRSMGLNVEQGVEFGEFAAHIHGLWSAVTDMEVYRAMLHASHTGESSYVNKVADPNNPNKLVSQRTSTQFANQFGAISNPRIPGVSIPTDLISAQDTVFRSWEMNAQLKTLAWREARADLGNKATTSDVWTLAQHKAANPTSSMIKSAFDETQRTLLLNDNKLNTWVNRARTYKPGMNFGERVGAFIASNLAPFIRVESNNLMNRIVQRSPLAFLDGHTRAQFKQGGAAADIAASKILYGTTLLGMYWLAAGGGSDSKLTGAGPDNVDKYKNAIAGGWRPDAVHENGTYNTGGQLGMSINPFDYHNKTAQLVASARQAWEAGASPSNKVGSFLMAMGSVFSNLAGMSWISDFQPAVDAARAHGQSAPKAVAATLGGIAQTWVPNALNQAARLKDPYQRDTDSESIIGGKISNSLQQEIPGLREQLPIKYSVYGTPLANGASLTGVHTIIGLSGNGTTETQDPTERELDRLNNVTSDHVVVTPVKRSWTIDGQKTVLSPAEFEEYQHTAGRYTIDNVRDAMSKPGWGSMSDADRVEIVHDIESEQKAKAREELFGQ